MRGVFTLPSTIFGGGPPAHRRALYLVFLGLLALAFLPVSHRLLAASSSTPTCNASVLVSGSQWAGSYANRDTVYHLNVYQNCYDSDISHRDQYAPEWQCVELAVRWAATAYGATWSGALYAYQMWDLGPSQKPIPFFQHPNGGPDAPQFGDLIVFNQIPSNTAGHVAVVSGTGPGSIAIVEQNINEKGVGWVGSAKLSISPNNSISPYLGMPVLGWLRPPNPVPPPSSSTPTPKPATLYNAADGNEEAYYRGSNNHLMETAWTGGSQPVTLDLGSSITGDPATLYNPAKGYEEAYYQGSNGHLMETYWMGSKPVTLDLGSQITGNQATLYNPADGNEEAYYRGSNGHLMETAWVSGKEVTLDLGAPMN